MPCLVASRWMKVVFAEQTAVRASRGGRPLQQERLNIFGISGKWVGLPGNHIADDLAAIRGLPGRPGKMGRHKLSVIVDQLGSGSDEGPAKCRRAVGGGAGA